jgi:hypothetical protein
MDPSPLHYNPREDPNTLVQHYPGEITSIPQLHFNFNPINEFDKQLLSLLLTLLVLSLTHPLPPLYIGKMDQNILKKMYLKDISRYTMDAEHCHVEGKELANLCSCRNPPCLCGDIYMHKLYTLNHQT